MWNAVFLATCLASGIAMMCMAFIANKPFCLAPGMGLNSFLALVVTQIAAIIPSAATSSALIYVGVLMLSGLKHIDFEDFEQVVPVALMLIAMPVSGSIGHAIGIGLISFTVINICTGKASRHFTSSRKWAATSSRDTTSPNRFQSTSSRRNTPEPNNRIRSS